MVKCLYYNIFLILNKNIREIIKTDYYINYLFNIFIFIFNINN